MREDYTHITIVLDRSGSMQNVATETISSFNAFLEDQKTVPGKATLTMVQFDDRYEVLYNGVDLKDVPRLTDETFVPRGYTALRDAIGKTVVDTGAFLASLSESERPFKVIFVIITDGQENASIEYSTAQISTMLQHQQTKYAWQFVYLGANQDAILVAQEFAIPTSGAAAYASTGPGVGNTYRIMSKSVKSVRTGQQVNCSFSPKERASMINPTGDKS